MHPPPISGVSSVSSNSGGATSGSCSTKLCGGASCGGACLGAVPRAPSSANPRTRQPASHSLRRSQHHSMKVSPTVGNKLCGRRDAFYRTFVSAVAQISRHLDTLMTMMKTFKTVTIDSESTVMRSSTHKILDTYLPTLRTQTCPERT